VKEFSQYIKPFCLIQCRVYTVSQKNKHNYFCYNYVKLPPNLTIFGTMTANCLKLYEVHSFFTSPNSRQCTTVLSVHVPNCYITLYTVSQKNNPPPKGPDISHFSHKRLRIFNRFFTHLLHIPIYARLQIFIQLSPILTKLCHIKHDYPVHIICSKCPRSVDTHALTRLRKSLIALSIVVCGK